MRANKQFIISLLTKNNISFYNTQSHHKKYYKTKLLQILKDKTNMSGGFSSLD